MRALDEYSPEERAYFQGLVPLEFEDLDGLAWEPAFSCPGGAFVRRVERRP